MIRDTFWYFSDPLHLSDILLFEITVFKTNMLGNKCKMIIVIKKLSKLNVDVKQIFLLSKAFKQCFEEQKNVTLCLVDSNP